MWETDKSMGAVTMSDATTINEMVESLKHLMGKDEKPANGFSQPTLLTEVPSFSSTDSAPQGAVIEHAELGRRFNGDRRGTAAG